MRIPSSFRLVLLIGWGSWLSADILYNVTDLGPLVGFGGVSAINNAGQAVGTSLTNLHAFLYSNGQVTDLGTLGDHLVPPPTSTIGDKSRAIPKLPPTALSTLFFTATAR